MNSILNYNGSLISTSSKSISAENQIAQYGVFETMRYSNSTIKNLADHFERLWKGLEVLKIKIPEYYNSEFLEEEVNKLFKSCEYKNARIRLSIIEKSGGTSSEKVCFIIETSPITAQQKNFITSDFSISLYNEVGIMAGKLSAIKTNNRLPYILAKKFADENNLNDAILLNQFGRICDSSIANIFLIKDEIIITPPISEGCVAGIMRRNIIILLSSLGYIINERPVDSETIKHADEIFLTNSIIGMQPVSNFNGKVLENKFSRKLFNLINLNSDLFS